ncbi:MFS transporter [Burkholderia vietnamiensis]|uniref:Major facilitator superfamily MFS_1 n=1 Tax=Burkholderia vietnamiensis (strain G4 / LMG 22486) TaxID=269482 RepID=A4JIC7_BURVG|nr:MFS transporter [Burkholderia vietnamiensis]ABO56030.1 major facilitator superfamily MFS_1 [Burkholderia vietnamiensis G4]MBR8086588.1 MFS transporter [Burkholderia vietnamiensis]MBR8204193.1 MFS transporter [Burkholderia vietnamiensis]MBR8218507.1 MFS transporter [Burkholderia vietnamiensis]MCA8393043.1 MFS transporter [Burkholderia vietnamiensis]
MDTSCLASPSARAGAARGPAHRWRVLAAGVAANMSFSAAAAGIPTTAVWMRSAYHLDNAALGLVLGALGFGVALSELPWGIAADRFGDRRVLLTGLVATAAMLAVMVAAIVPSAHAVPPLLRVVAAMCCVGLLGGSVNGSSGRAVMRWFGERERGLAMSIRQTAVPLGGGVGAALLPALASHAGFAAVYGALMLLCAGSAALTWRWLHEPPVGVVAFAPSATSAASVATATSGASDSSVASAASVPSATSRTSDTSAASAAPSTSSTSTTPPAAQQASAAPARGPLASARVWRIVLGIGALCAPQFAVLTFATVFLHDFGRLGLAGISTAMVALQAGAMVMRVWSGRHTDRHGNRRAYLRGSVCVAAGAFSLLAAATAASPYVPLGAIVAILVFAGICVSAWHGVAYTELATLAGANHAGTALGMANTVVYLGLFATPLAIPPLLAVSSWSVVWLATALIAAATYPLFAR